MRELRARLSMRVVGDIREHMRFEYIRYQVRDSQSRAIFFRFLRFVRGSALGKVHMS